MDELPQAAADFRTLVRVVIEKIFINNPNQIVPGTNYPYRELVGLDKELQTWEGGRNNNLVKFIASINDKISDVENILKQEDIPDEERDMLNEG